jgi:hypothetical protein
MTEESVLPRFISDIEFQKRKWRSKRNRILINWHWGIDLEAYTNWIVKELEGEWHFKENFTSKNSNICFWFELDEDAVYFKLTWIS